MGWFAQSFSCQTQPLCCVEVRVRVGVLTIFLAEWTLSLTFLVPTVVVCVPSTNIFIGDIRPIVKSTPG